MKLALDKSGVIVLGVVLFCRRLLSVMVLKRGPTSFKYTASATFGASFFIFPDGSQTIWQGTSPSDIQRVWAAGQVHRRLFYM